MQSRPRSIVRLAYYAPSLKVSARAVMRVNPCLWNVSKQRYRRLLLKSRPTHKEGKEAEVESESGFRPRYGRDDDDREDAEDDDDEDDDDDA